MNRIRLNRQDRSRAGSALIEFALVCFLLFVVIFATFEFCRMLLVSTTVANAARAGCRYAITHGGTANVSAIQTVVTNFASVGPLDTTALTVSVCYPYSAGTCTA